MDFTEWEPLYLKILSRFEFSQEKDEKAALWMSEKFKRIKNDVITQNGSLIDQNPINQNLKNQSLTNQNLKNQSLADQNLKKQSFADQNLKKQSFEGQNLKDRSEPLLKLKFKITCRPVVVCGNAPSLEKELSKYLEERRPDDTFIAADGAASVLLKCGQIPDIIVTDLDGGCPNDAAREIEAAGCGTHLIIHAHGDNIDILEKYMPSMIEIIKNGMVTPTCQCLPPYGLYNFGGFTDGDRGVFLAEAFGAEKITLIGFDFNDRNVTDLKKKKLECAKKLIQLLSSKNPGKI